MSDFEMIKLGNELKMKNMINSYSIDGLFTDEEKELVKKAIKIHILNNAKELLRHDELTNEIRNMVKK